QVVIRYFVKELRQGFNGNCGEPPVCHDLYVGCRKPIATFPDWRSGRFAVDFPGKVMVLIIPVLCVNNFRAELQNLCGVVLQKYDRAFLNSVPVLLVADVSVTVLYNCFDGSEAFGYMEGCWKRGPTGCRLTHH